MKKSLRKKTYSFLFSLAVLAAFMISVKTGLFHDFTSWAGAKFMEPLMPK
jgi:hypothetical protein